ncbi:hypothetical protein PEX1_046160 [Penicillium expansum]|uniref:Uncharacterized protein n=1 Tax=Penicillium expansum TaxID=27334 RepID=A0A0A2K8S2_PENEN|nr:hypothetical protein PEX2_078470 [Penicillium expansum]KGO42199.1 hypothetical protein PEXP_051490 [Penicillium expansum]KGO56240.1 hypothetical protein PEX2_078470 [Penicillium expansum]KGO64232.1 hypothetical protein PEX1_046160 [Penicillium expansum]
MGNRSLEATSTQHLGTQVPGTNNQPCPKPRCEQLAYLTRNKEPRMYLGTAILTPGYRNPIRRSTSASTLYEYLNTVDVPEESDDSHTVHHGEVDRCISVAEEGGWGPIRLG